jgi:ATP-dependent protease ClpP protease subunit
MSNKQKELEDKLAKFQEEISKRFDDPKFSKKFENYRKKLEDLVDCEVRVEILASTKFKDELSELGINPDSEGFDEMEEGSDYWNKYSTTIRELNDYYIDIDNRTVFYSYDIQEGTPFFLETKIKTIEKLNPLYEGEEDGYINLHINSYGGDAYGMLGTIDVIRLSNFPIKGIAKGQVMSAGALILIGCHKRVMTKNSIMMIHDLNTFLGGAYKDIASEYDHIKTLQKIVYQYLEDHSNKDKEWWETKLQRNLYLTASEAMDLGLIDEII